MTGYTEEFAAAATTENKRMVHAAYVTADGQPPMIVSKVFMPMPEGFRDAFPDQDKGEAPGLTWRVLKGKDDGLVVFEHTAYTLEFALALSSLFTTLLHDAGQLDGMLHRVTLLGPGCEDATLAEIVRENEAHSQQQALHALRLAEELIDPTDPETPPPSTSEVLKAIHAALRSARGEVTT